jgi:peroxiredoxin
MKYILTLSFGLLFLMSCQEKPGKILATSTDPTEINNALYRLGLDTTKAIPKGLEDGSLAPYFSGIDQKGRTITLNNLTSKGRVVVFFYRGYWCGICSKHLSNFQDSLHLITETGANVIAIAPERSDYAERTILKNNLKFSVLSDASQTIMNSFGVKYDVNTKMQKNVGIDWEKVNGGAVLPVPATYIINQNGRIIKSFFTPDFNKRASVNEIVKILENN